MTLNLNNLAEVKGKLARCDTATFRSRGDSYLSFVRQLRIVRFRHLHDLCIDFEHPVTVIAGTNTIGKTSLLLLLACSHERFMKVDSTSPTPSLREHSWNDVMSFTSHEAVDEDYVYELEWRVGTEDRTGTGKRLARTGKWGGLGKKDARPDRKSAKIRDREVRLVDLERILPGRSFTSALYRKANEGSAQRLAPDVEKAFAYVFGVTSVELSALGGHINKQCFLISEPERSYSTYNAASGQESVIYLLRDIIESPSDTLVLIDEVEAGFHPSVQRRLADVIQYIAWRDKKQFVITTHSPTLLTSFPARSRRFIESKGTGFRVIKGISAAAARSKMDSIGYPLVRLYCEDELAAFLIRKILIAMADEHPFADRLVNIICSGPINAVKNDYVRDSRNFSQMTNRVGYCAVFDGDHKDHPEFSNYFENPNELVTFLFPYEAPEKFLVRAYLREHSSPELEAGLAHNDHHTLFQVMVNLGLAADAAEARGLCYSAFEVQPEYTKHSRDLEDFLTRVLTHFTEVVDES